MQYVKINHCDKMIVLLYLYRNQREIGKTEKQGEFYEVRSSKNRRMEITIDMG